MKIAEGKKMNRLIAPFFSLFILAGCSTQSGSSGGGTASAKVHTELAGLYYDRAQFGVALEEVEYALQSDKSYAPAYYMRGLIHMELREDKDADEDFQKSIRLDKTDPKAHYNYGLFLCQRGREKESVTQFVEAVKNPLYATPGLAYLNAGLCSRTAGNNKDAEDFMQKALRVQPELTQAMFALAEINFANADYFAAKKYFASLSQKTDNLTAEQLWLGVRINRKVGDHNSEASYGTQLRNRFPEARETQLLIHGE
jgi:type IV pilus assembly protein PilF